MKKPIHTSPLLFAGLCIVAGIGEAFSQQLPLPRGTPGNWKKAYANVGIDTANTQLNTLSPKETALGWELLFNGTISDAQTKWKAFKANNFPAWELNDTALARIAGAGDIMTRKAYRNFVWTAEWKISVGGNSGMFYHADESEANGYFTGPEVQILHNQKHGDGAINGGLNSAGSFYDHYKPINQGDDPAAPPVADPNSKPFIDPTSTDQAGNPSGYNRVIVVVNGKKHEWWFNGIRVVSVDVGSQEFQLQKSLRKFKTYPKFAALDVGYLFLQDHGNQVWFRNLKVRPLPDAGATFAQIWPGYTTVSIQGFGEAKPFLRRGITVRSTNGGYLLDLLKAGSYQVTISTLKGEVISRLKGEGGSPLRLDRSEISARSGTLLISASNGESLLTGTLPPSR